jgi:quercetin dioxygenase-like cupin family protein
MSNLPDPNEALAADLVDALLADSADEAPSPRLAARIKHRVLERIARAEAGHVTVQAADDRWRRFQHGVQIKVLHEAGGVMSYLLRLAPGAVLAAHRHPMDEECMVLEGSLKIGADLVISAGGFHLAHKDALHAPITTTTGATIFLRGAPPHPTVVV